MSRKQYNNIITKTLKRCSEEESDNLGKVREIFKNMGVAFPHGECKKVLDTLKTNDYMAWRKFDIKEAKEKANNGTATIAIGDDRVKIVPADDSELISSVDTDVILNISPATSAFEVSDLQFYSYSSGGTGGNGGGGGLSTSNPGGGNQGGNSTVILPQSIHFNDTNIEMEINEEYDPMFSIIPDYATNYHLTWSSSDENVARVDPKTGHITASGIGHAMVSVSVEECNVSSQFEVHVVRKEISLPSNRTYNWNQFYAGVKDAIKSTEGCYWVCALDVANIYGPSSYSPADFAFAWGNDGYTGAFPENCAASWGRSYSSNIYDVIRTEINNNRPVVIKTRGTYIDENGKVYYKFHWVVAYGYTENGDSKDKIKVFDPAQSPSDTTSMTGRDTTLDNAMTWNKKDTIIGIITVSGAR